MHGGGKGEKRPWPPRLLRSDAQQQKGIPLKVFRIKLRAWEKLGVSHQDDRDHKTTKDTWLIAGNQGEGKEAKRWGRRPRPFGGKKGTEWERS